MSDYEEGCYTGLVVGAVAGILGFLLGQLIFGG